MTFVSLEPEDLQTFIDNLSAFAEDQDTARTTVHTSLANNQYPFDSYDPALDTQVGESSTIAQQSLDLATVATDLQTRLDEAVYMNSNGLTFGGAEGQYGYYLPEDAEDTATNVTQYNSGAVADAQADARAVREAMRNGEYSGPEWDALMASVSDRAGDNPVYATQFVRTAGSDYLLDLALAVNDGAGTVSPQTQTVLNTLSVVYNSASQLYTSPSELPEGSTPGWSVVDDLTRAVTHEGHQGRATVLDAILNHPNQPAAPYGTDFLTDLAFNMESWEEWTRVAPRMSTGVGNTPMRVIAEDTEADDGSSMLPGYSADGLAAVLGAMGTNPEAAVAFFSADGDPSEHGDEWIASAPLEDRFDALTERLSGFGIDGTRMTAAMSAASSLRQPPALGVSTDERAAWVTRNAVEYLADLDIPLQDSSGNPEGEEMRQHIGIILGNCAPELTADASGASVLDEHYPIVPLFSNNQERAEGTEDMWELVEEISTSESAMTALGQGSLVYASNRAAHRAEGAEGREAAQDEIAAAFHDEQQLLDEVASRVGSDGSAAVLNGVNAGASLLALAPGGAAPGGLLQAGVSLAQTQAPPAPVSPVPASAINVAMIQTALNTGALDESHLVGEPWYDEETNTIDLTRTPEGAGLFQGWVNSQTSKSLTFDLRREAQAFD